MWKSNLHIYDSVILQLYVKKPCHFNLHFIKVKYLEHVGPIVTHLELVPQYTFCEFGAKLHQKDTYYSKLHVVRFLKFMCQFHK